MAKRSVEESASDLGLAGEQEWLSLRRQLELAADPWLGFIFCPAPGPVAVLRQRTEFMLRYRAQQLLHIAPASPKALRELLPQLFESLPQADCVWVEAIAVDGPLCDDELGPWAAAWDWLMLRLNERRDACLRRMKGALVFAVHPSWKPRVRNAAPDVWSVRSLVLDLEGNSGPQTYDPSVSMTLSDPDDNAEYVPSVHDALAAVNRLAATPSPDSRSLARLHMRAASALLAADQASEAAEQTDQALAVLRDRPVRLRAQALMLAARVKRADNDVAAALDHLGEAVALWRSILDEHGEAPQTRRDLAFALFEMGGLYIEGRDTMAAKAACEESLATSRQLLETTRETPESLRDLSVSLNRMGDIHDASGDAAAAKAAYEESLALRRRLLAATGETPQRLRDISVSLNRVGDIYESSGDAAAAKAAYEESLALCRRLLAATGETPQSLRDLSVSLNRMGGIHRSTGDKAAAKAAYEESLALCRRLLEMGETPLSLRDLSVSLDRVGDLYELAGDKAAAKAAREQSLALRQRRDALFS